MVDVDAVNAYAKLLIHQTAAKTIRPAEHHNVWLELFCDESIKKLLIISPPDSAKTTWAMAYLGCMIGVFPERNYVIGSVTDDVAEKRSLALRNIVSSPEWKSLFVTVVPNEKMKWEQIEWSVKDINSDMLGELHPTVRAYGAGSSSITGSRADLLLGDDLLSKENTATQGQRDKFRSWMDSQFLTRLKPNGRVILIGTAYNSADYYSKIRKDALGWVICHCMSYQEQGFDIFLTYPDGYSGRMLGNANN